MWCVRKDQLVNPLWRLFMTCSVPNFPSTFFHPPSWISIRVARDLEMPKVPPSLPTPSLPIEFEKTSHHSSLNDIWRKWRRQMEGGIIETMKWKFIRNQRIELSLDFDSEPLRAYKLIYVTIFVIFWIFLPPPTSFTFNVNSQVNTEYASMCKSELKFEFRTLKNSKIRMTIFHDFLSNSLCLAPLPLSLPPPTIMTFDLSRPRPINSTNTLFSPPWAPKDAWIWNMWPGKFKGGQLRESASSFLSMPFLRKFYVDVNPLTPSAMIEWTISSSSFVFVQLRGREEVGGVLKESLWICSSIKGSLMDFDSDLWQFKTREKSRFVTSSNAINNRYVNKIVSFGKFTKGKFRRIVSRGRVQKWNRYRRFLLTWRN